MAHEKRKRNRIAVSGDEKDQVDAWSKIKQQSILCGVKAEIRNRGRIVSAVQRHRLRWYGHILRNDELWLKSTTFT